MIFAPVNLENKLKNLQKKSVPTEDILDMVYGIIRADNLLENRIETSLDNFQNTNFNAFNLELLDPERIYHISIIKKICIDYRLRFLDSHFFKPKVPYEAVCEIKRLEKIHETELKGFKIVAPSKLMKLENADDPLLFAPIGNGYFYLIHKWGSDLHPFRKWLYLPFKNINNILVTALLFSFFVTLCLPNAIFDPASASTQFWFLFLFIFKAVGFVVIFYGVSQGKNFNEQIWNNKYYN